MRTSIARRGSRCAVAVLVVAACGSPPPRGGGNPGPADLVFRDAAVYTVDAARSWASAVAVRDGRIIYVGGDSLPPGLIGPTTDVVDLQRKMVLPGFQDGHVHPIDSGVDLGECSLDSLGTEAAITGAIRAYGAAHPELSWVRGSGWQLPVFRAGNPSKTLLDRILPDRPAIFAAADGHSAWVNSKALELAGITRTTPNPPNGRIERDVRTGEPSGTLREDAIDLVTKVIPDRTDAELAAGLERAEKLANRFGITTVFDATVKEPGLRAYAAAERNGTLTLRVIAALNLGQPLPDSMLPALLELRTRYDPADIPRFQALGVVANFQAFWANGDEYLTRMTEPTLGPARSRWLYPIASVVRTGAVVSGGSDWSVSSLNPLDAIEVGITHRQPDQPGQVAWHPAERVDLATMVAMYTINAAYGNHQERDTGSIEVGKLADLIVLDRNLFEIAPTEIHTVRVVRTLLEGVTVFNETTPR